MDFATLADFGVVNRPRGSFPRFNADTVGTIWVDAVVNLAGSRLPDVQDDDRLFPTADELRSKGVDVAKLAVCIKEGLIVLAEFGNDLKRTSVEELNGALEHLLERSVAYQAHPHDLMDRFMHLDGGSCGCGRGQKH
ncbi:MAG: hypothetical protein K2X77_34120 [Candidatus Obscuribacterales bacterium]|jgi:hypothetical protein|nr:hypothetical protein [Candidatus Obscuribacterales bacterium]